MLFDTHCHLTDRSYPDPGAIIRQAHEHEVTLLLTVGLDRPDSEAAIRLAKQNSGVYAGIGIHPHAADRFCEEDIACLRKLAQHPKVKAIGETGLDYYRNYARHENQQRSFRAHIELARELNLPLILHIRDAYPEALAILKEHGYFCGVLHCYSGDRVFAEEAAALGFFIAFSGSLTYSRQRLPEVARAVPLDQLLIETDAPFLTPVPYRGKMRNEPALVRFVAMELARLRNRPFQELARITLENGKRLFRIA